MTYEAMSTCAALVFSMAVEDYAAISGKSIEDVRREMIESKAYECLLNFDSGLWMDPSSAIVAVPRLQTVYHHTSDANRHSFTSFVILLSSLP